MKFLALKEALELYEEKKSRRSHSSHVAGIMFHASRPTNGHNSRHDQLGCLEPAALPRQSPQPKRRENVVGGEIIWQPIDRVARRVISPAPWWAVPISVPVPKPSTEKPEPKKEIRMAQSPEVMRGKAASYQNPTAEQITESTKAEKTNSVCVGAVKATEKAIGSTEELLDRTIDARMALDELSSKWSHSWVEFMTTTNTRLHELRMARMAINTEMRQLMSGFRDVRQFFLDQNYQTERDRLKEFIGLCERLKGLKESGFLDTVADTMLRLAGVSQPTPTPTPPPEIPAIAEKPYVPTWVADGL